MLVLGGGPAGLAIAIGLCQAASLSVLVVEQGKAPMERYGETLPPDILLLLERLGLVSEFRRAGHLPCPGSVSIWGRAKPGHNDFILNPMGPAWHLSRRRFEAMLEGRALGVGAIVARQTRFLGAQRAGDAGYQVRLGQPEQGEISVFARWVIDAAGSPARFARRQGAGLVILDRMVAVARFARRVSGTLTSQTLLEATAEGWWYGARLPDDRLVTLLMTEPEDAHVAVSDDHRGWHSQLSRTQLLAPRLAGCALETEAFRSFPVVPAFLDTVQGEGWLAIGDAASSYDPIAAQGIYKALGDAADATRTVLAGLGHGPPPGWRYGERMEERRRDDLIRCADLYDLEERWGDSNFWRRRRAASRRWRALAAKDGQAPPAR